MRTMILAVQRFIAEGDRVQCVWGSVRHATVIRAGMAERKSGEGPDSQSGEHGVDRENDVDSGCEGDGAHVTNQPEKGSVAGETATGSPTARTGNDTPPPQESPQQEQSEKQSDPESPGDHAETPPKRGRFNPMRYLSNWTGSDRQSTVPDPAKICDLPIKEKRKFYKCGENYLTLKRIPTWAVFHKDVPPPKNLKQTHIRLDKELNQKVSLWRGDITQLEIGAIVNAANSSLLGGGGVDGAIHRAAGRGLLDECRQLHGCRTGDTKLTKGYKLPAKYVLHTVGPMDENQKALKSCYQRCLELALTNNIRSLAFPCVATGIYGFPNDKAANVALRVTRDWLEKHREKVDRIIFCVFLDVDYRVYCRLLHQYFPVDTPTSTQDSPEVTVPGAVGTLPFKPAMNRSISAPVSSTSEGSREGPGVSDMEVEGEGEKGEQSLEGENGGKEGGLGREGAEDVPPGAGGGPKSTDSLPEDPGYD